MHARFQSELEMGCVKLAVRRPAFHPCTYCEVASDVIPAVDASPRSPHIAADIIACSLIRRVVVSVRARYFLGYDGGRSSKSLLPLPPKIPPAFHCYPQTLHRIFSFYSTSRRFDNWSSEAVQLSSSFRACFGALAL